MAEKTKDTATALPSLTDTVTLTKEDVKASGTTVSEPTAVQQVQAYNEQKAASTTAPAPLTTPVPVLYTPIFGGGARTSTQDIEEKIQEAKIIDSINNPTIFGMPKNMVIAGVVAVVAYLVFVKKIF
jgi:hypothetical protein